MEAIVSESKNEKRGGGFVKCLIWSGLVTFSGTGSLIEGGSNVVR